MEVSQRTLGGEKVIVMMEGVVEGGCWIRQSWFVHVAKNCPRIVVSGSRCDGMTVSNGIRWLRLRLFETIDLRFAGPPTRRPAAMRLDDSLMPDVASVVWRDQSLEFFAEYQHPNMQAR